MLSILYNNVKYAYDTNGIKGGNAERVCRVAQAKLGLGQDSDGQHLAPDGS